MTDRRTFVRAGAACLGFRSLRVAAQTNLLRWIGFVGNASSATWTPQLDALRLGLRERGWIDGRDVVIESRWAEGNPDRLAPLIEELITRQMRLLKEAVPRLSGVALLRHVGTVDAIVAAAKVAARSLGLAVQTLAVAQEAEFDGAFKAARSMRADAIHVLPSPFLGARRARLIELAARYRLPAFCELEFYVRDGGLMSDGPSIDDMWGGLQATSIVS